MDTSPAASDTDERATDREAGARRLLCAFVFTDLVGSTELKRTLGDAKAVALIARHNEIFRRCLKGNRGIEKANPGDGFFATFDLPSNAVRCALAFQQGLASLAGEHRLLSRVGIHAGETLVMQDNDETPHEVMLGLAVDMASRVMSLAEPGQILMTPHVFDSVRQHVDAAPDRAPIRWLAHGPYRFKGIDDLFEIFEVGVEGLSPLRPPAGSAKALRAVAPSEEEVLGWRPALALEVPGRPGWRLQQRLGAGGFGEVWLARNDALGERRAFKFCFDANRVRGLKREVILFRLLRETLGERSDIARIVDWHIDRPPFFVESEYTDGGSIADWAELRGGPAAIPLDDRIEIVAQVGEALAAAHSVGVLHKDIKASNILITKSPSGKPLARLADFGIGLITDRTLLREKGLPMSSLTLSSASSGSSSGTGTQLYMAPELFQGEPATIYSDVYSLGVLLFQLVTADLRAAIGAGWEARVDDELLREDIAACIQLTPTNRLANARELSERLRSLDDRRAQLAAERRAREEREQRLTQLRADKKRRERLRLTSAIGLMLLALVGLGVSWHRLRRSQAVADWAQSAVLHRLNHSNLAAAYWLAQAIQRELDATRLFVELAAQDRALRDGLQEGDSARLFRTLEKIWRRYRSPAISRWVVADESGQMIARIPADGSNTIGRTFSDRDWFNGGDATKRPVTKTHVSEPFVSRSDVTRLLVGVSAPIRATTAENGKILGVLLATISLDDMAKWVQEVPRLSVEDEDALGITAELRAVVVNERNQVVLHPDLKVEQDPAWKAPLWDVASLRAAAPSAGIVADPITGRSYLTGFQRMANDDWVVLAALPADQAEAATGPLSSFVAELQLANLTITLIGAMVLVGWAWITWTKRHESPEE